MERLIVWSVWSNWGKKHQIFNGTIKFFNESFDELERALYAGDADLFIGANNKIQEGLGQKPLFGNQSERSSKIRTSR